MNVSVLNPTKKAHVYRYYVTLLDGGGWFKPKRIFAEVYGNSSLTTNEVISLFKDKFKKLEVIEVEGGELNFPPKYSKDRIVIHKDNKSKIFIL